MTEQPTSSSPDHYVKSVGNLHFVAGLFWQSLNQSSTPPLQQARTLGASLNFDLHVLYRNENSTQAGFAHSANMDLDNGSLVSLAALLSHLVAESGLLYEGRVQSPPNWLGAFSLQDDDRWVYIAVREFSILATGDFIGSREEVLQRLQSDYAIGGWTAVIGDAELAGFGFSNFNERNLEDMVFGPADQNPRSVRPFLLKASQKATINPRLIVGVAIALLLLAGAAAGGWWWQKKKDEEEQARKRAEALAHPVQQVVVLPAPHPWKTMPLPVDYAQACQAGRAYLVALGWVMESYECKGNAATTNWKRGEYGNAATLRNILPKATMTPEGDTATQTDTLPDPNPANFKDEELETSDIATANFIGVFQTWKITPTLTLRPPPPPPPPPDLSQPQSAQGPTYAPPTWKTYDFSVSIGPIPPSAIAERLQRPGIRFTEMGFTGANWTIKGELYAN